MTTVEQFSSTRFGSQRLRPDHETMKRIQKAAGHAQHDPRTASIGDSLRSMSPSQRKELLDFLRRFRDPETGM